MEPESNLAGTHNVTEHEGQDRQPRIALYLPSMGGGGAERLFLNLARGFQGRGVDVDVVLAQAKGPYLEQLPQAAHVVDLGASRVLRSVPALVSYLRRRRPVAMLSALGHCNVVAVWAKWLARVPTRIVVSEHNIPQPIKLRPKALTKLLLDIWIKLTYPFAWAVIGVSHDVVEHVKKRISWRSLNIQLIYNPIDLVQIETQSSAKLNAYVGRNDFLVLGIGRLTPQKGFSTLIDAFALVRQQIQCDLLILGEGELRSKLEDQVRQLGLQPAVSLPGFVDNPFPFLKRANLLVCSSYSEGFGNVLVEALACGCPVVSTDCPGGPAEILENGKYGLLVPVGDAEALAKAMLFALRYRPPAGLLRQRAQDFSLDPAVDQYLEVLLGAERSDGHR